MKRILLYGLCIVGLACTPRDQNDGDPGPSPTQTPETGAMDDYENDRGTEDLGTTRGMNGVGQGEGQEELPPFHVLDENNDGVLDQGEIASLDPELRAQLDNIPRDDQGQITQEAYNMHREAH